MRTVLIFTTFFSFLMPTLSMAEDIVEVTDAWIAEAPPTAKVLAGYMQLENKSEKGVVLTGAQSSDFESVEIHETVIKADKVSMVAHETLAISAGETIAFKPGGFHLMLMGAKKPFKVGETTEITLKFLGDTSQTVQMVVKKRSEEQAHEHEHHH